MNKRTKKRLRNKKSKKNMKGGAGFLRNLFSAVTPGTNQPKENPKQIKKREENPKQVKDFMKMVEKKNLSKDKYESKMNISQFKATDLSKKDNCKGKKLNVEIDRNNPVFRDFVRAHNNITEHYVKYNKLFLSLITDNIVQEAPNSQYIIRRLDNDTLNRIEKDTRKNLMDYYTKCQKLFTDNFALLVEAVEKSGIKEVVNTPINNNNNTQNNLENAQNKLENAKNNIENNTGNAKNNAGNTQNNAGNTQNNEGNNKNENNENNQ